MALTYTPANETRFTLPDFKLPTVDGKNVDSLSITAAPAKLVVFICAHCPYVQAIEERLIQLGKDLQNLGVPMLAICSNDATDYPEDSPEALKKRANEKGYSFPYLVDESQVVAKAFAAVCTPDFFVFGRNNELAYRGRLDDSWKDASKVTKRELYEAILMVMNGQTPKDQKPSMGCSIKWK